MGPSVNTIAHCSAPTQFNKENQIKRLFSDKGGLESQIESGTDVNTNAHEIIYSSYSSTRVLKLLTVFN